MEGLEAKVPENGLRGAQVLAKVPWREEGAEAYREGEQRGLQKGRQVFGRD